MGTISHYAVLGVPNDASFDAIKAAYRRKLLEVHPDKIQSGAAPAISTASKSLSDLQQAFAVLKDAQARAIYDSQLRGAEQRSRFEGVPWMTIHISDMDLVEGPQGQLVYEYDCRCGGVFELSIHSARDLAAEAIQLTCYHCTSALQVTS